MNKYDLSAIPYLHVDKTSYLIKTPSARILLRRGLDRNVAIIDGKSNTVLDELNYQDALDLATWILNTHLDG